MKIMIATALAALLLAPAAAEAANRHFPVNGPTPAGNSPPFSGGVMAGNTLYVSGTTDNSNPATVQPSSDIKAGVTAMLNRIKATLAAAGMTMDDLVWVQVFCSDLKYYGDFNEVYRSYFKGPLPARAFIGAGSLLNNSRFEVMGIAVRSEAAAKAPAATP
jgi:2-iminobutanoate/2-iminopropanoate deaminase